VERGMRQEAKVKGNRARQREGEDIYSVKINNINRCFYRR